MTRAIQSTAHGAAHGVSAEHRANKVPPRQNDVMHGPVYTPGPPPVQRPGALRFMEIKSHGYRC